MVLLSMIISKQEKSRCLMLLRCLKPLADARTELRRQAADIGANGILMKNCQVIETDEQDCFSRALCVGEAISISQESN
jgi:hypothetical protein